VFRWARNDKHKRGDLLRDCITMMGFTLVLCKPTKEHLEIVEALHLVRKGFPVDLKIPNEL
jgi:hypothetical protein